MAPSTELEAGVDDHRLRIDRYLRRHIDGLSRGKAMRMIHAGRVAVNDRAVGSEHYVKEGDRVRIDADDPGSATPAPTLGAHDVLYDDDALVAVNKPAGLDSQPTPAGASNLLDQARALLGASLELVHRLDRGTSGVILLGRDAAAATHLGRQLARGTIAKHYRALVFGLLRDDAGEIRQPLSAVPASRSGRIYAKSRGGGRKAITRYRVLERRDGQTLLELEPLTGRRHQLRAHLSGLGYPVVGDVLYGGAPASRLFLHAASIALSHPRDGRPLLIAAPIPIELEPGAGVGAAGPTGAEPLGS